MWDGLPPANPSALRLATWIGLALLGSCGPSGASAPESGGATGSGNPKTARRAGCSLAEAGCHAVADCHGRGICEPAPPSSDPGCGIPPSRVEACKVDSDCKPGEACNAFRSGCEVGHRCEARCETAGCTDGWACGKGGRCAPRLCPAAWDCGDYGTCHPPASGEGPLQGGRDWHGCVALPCSRDADCPCAHCVNSACTPIPGRCIEPRG